jgi:Bacterial lectin
MRARSNNDAPSTALRVVFAAVFAAAPLAACGLSLNGLAPLGDAIADAALVDSPRPLPVEASTAGDAPAGSDRLAPDAAADSSLSSDSAADTSSPCVPYDAGIGGTLDLSTFVLAGTAVYDENADGRITLTNSDNDQAGAAWYPTPIPDVSGYDLTWSLRVGPDDTAGEGITFAVLSSDGTPTVGDDGNGLGLRNITESGGDGGIPSGYAVEVVMYDNTSDPTNLGPTTLKLATMPGFTPIAEVLVPGVLNDGNTYAVDVSWRAPSYLSATLHGPDGGVTNVTSSNPGLTASTASFGFTGATGGISDSHNEITAITVNETCH